MIQFSNLFSPLADFIFPPLCFSCNNEKYIRNHLLCKNCFNKLQHPTEYEIAFEFQKSFTGGGYIEKIYPLYKFEKDSPLQNLLHQLKYNQKFIVGKLLGREIALKFFNELSSSQIDFIVPVPLFHSKKAERGYNQSAFIASGIAKVLGIGINTRSVSRIKFTASQTSLTAEERKRNIENVFKARLSERIKEKNILLVDDVITTGATLNELAKELKSAQAKKIFAASIALA